MTSTQLTKLEAELERRGYKKWTTCLIGREDYDWVKQFGVHPDEDGDRVCDYQIAFRVYDWRKCKDLNMPKQSEIGVTVTMIPINLDHRLDFDYSLQTEVPDVSLCEAMMKDLYETAKKHINL